MLHVMLDCVICVTQNAMNLKMMDSKHSTCIRPVTQNADFMMMMILMIYGRFHYVN